MKILHSLTAISLVFLLSLTAFASGSANYKAKYNRQLIVNRAMIATDAMILTWFNQHQDYKKYQSISDKVKYLHDELEKAKESHKKAKAFANNEDWENAYKWAKQEWEHLNNIAVKGKKTQDNLKELEGEK